MNNIHKIPSIFPFNLKEGFYDWIDYWKWQKNQGLHFLSAPQGAGSLHFLHLDNDSWSLRFPCMKLGSFDKEKDIRRPWNYLKHNEGHWAHLAVSMKVNMKYKDFSGPMDQALTDDSQGSHLFLSFNSMAELIGCAKQYRAQNLEYLLHSHS